MRIFYFTERQRGCVWQTNSTHQEGGLKLRLVWAVGLFPGSSTDVADPTDADAGRTDVSVDFVSANRSSDTPAVASDGDLDVSRRTLAPGLVRRADAAPCVSPATANRNHSSQLTAAAALTMRSSTSPNKVT